MKAEAERREAEELERALLEVGGMTLPRADEAEQSEGLARAPSVSVDALGTVHEMMRRFHAERRLRRAGLVVIACSRFRLASTGWPAPDDEVDSARSDASGFSASSAADEVDGLLALRVRSLRSPGTPHRAPHGASPTCLSPLPFAAGGARDGLSADIGG